MADPSCIKHYAERLPTQHEHAREIRELLGLREFADAEAEQLAAVNTHLVEQTPVEIRRELLETLVVPAGKKVSPLEWMRTTVALMSGAGTKEALNRSVAVWAFSVGAVDVGGVAPVKLTELAAYGMSAKAPKIGQLKGSRRVATLRHLEGVSVDDALLLFDLLMSLPKLRKAALQAELALRAALDTPMTQQEQPAQPDDQAGQSAESGPVVRETTASEMIARLREYCRRAVD